MGEVDGGWRGERESGWSEGVDGVVWEREGGKRREKGGRIVGKEREVRNIGGGGEWFGEDGRGRGKGSGESEG